MRVCLILEGCYPYTHGGVSAWTDNFIRLGPKNEYVLWTIGAASAERGQFKFQLPDNVAEVRELFLDDALSLHSEAKAKKAFSDKEVTELLKMIRCEDPDWDVIFRCYNEKKTNPVAFLMSEAFLDLLQKMCREDYRNMAFSDLFYTMRSMFLPVMYLMTQDVPEADLYHSLASGYGGIIGALAKWKTGNPFVLSEHGIYPREREEEILRSQWIVPEFKDMWIKMFYMFSRCAYDSASEVTALFGRASQTQQDIGCDAKKCSVVPNGICLERYVGIPEKKPDDMVQIGAIVRLAPIKDIKTMLYAFAELTAVFPNAHLDILGDVDDDEYRAACERLLEELQLEEKASLVGNQNVCTYMAKFDFTVLTSISEGQPFALMESFAAARPVVATDVGCCREMILGDMDENYPCGFVCPPMDYIAIKRAMLLLCQDPVLRRQMGERAKRRAENCFQYPQMVEGYARAYERAILSGRNRV